MPSLVQKCNILLLSIEHLDVYLESSGNGIRPYALEISECNTRMATMGVPQRAAAVTMWVHCGTPTGTQHRNRGEMITLHQLPGTIGFSPYWWWYLQCEKSDSWRQARSVKTAEKSHERYHNVVMWHWIVYKWRRSNQMLSFHRTIFQFTRLHGVAVMQGLTFRDSVVTLFKSTRWYVLSGTGFLVTHQLYIGNVMRKYKIGKSSPHQPCENICRSNVLELSLLWMARGLACF